MQLGVELETLWLSAMVRTGRRGMTDAQLLEEGERVFEWLWWRCLGEERGGDGNPEYANHLVWTIFEKQPGLVKQARKQVRREAARDPVRRAEARRAAARTFASSREERHLRADLPALIVRPVIHARARGGSRRDRRVTLRRAPARSPGRPRPADDGGADDDVSNSPKCPRTRKPPGPTRQQRSISGQAWERELGAFT